MTVPSAIEAARVLRPDVVLLDIGLPAMDGYEVARRLRAEEFGKKARIIAMTGYGQEEDLHAIASRGLRPSPHQARRPRLSRDPAGPSPCV